MLVALDAIGVPGYFTPEEYAQNPRPAGIRLKPPQSQLYADVFRAESWFNFDEHWNEAHGRAPVQHVREGRVETRAAAVDRARREAGGEEPRDVELLRRAAGE